MDDGIVWSASLTVAFFFRQRIYPVLSFSSSGKAWKHVTNRIDKHMYLFIALSIIIRSPVYLKIERLSTTILITRVFVLRFCIGEPWAETYLFLASWHAFLSIQRVTLLVCSVGNWWIRQLRSCLSWLLDRGLLCVLVAVVFFDHAECICRRTGCLDLTLLLILHCSLCRNGSISPFYCEDLQSFYQRHELAGLQLETMMGSTTG